MGAVGTVRKGQLAAVMERYDIQWEQKAPTKASLRLGLQEAGTGEEVAALDTTLAEKQDELEKVQSRIDNFNQGVQSIESWSNGLKRMQSFSFPIRPR